MQVGSGFVDSAVKFFVVVASLRCWFSWVRWMVRWNHHPSNRPNFWEIFRSTLRLWEWSRTWFISQPFRQGLCLSASWTCRVGRCFFVLWLASQDWGHISRPSQNWCLRVGVAGAASGIYNLQLNDYNFTFSSKNDEYSECHNAICTQWLQGNSELRQRGSWVQIPLVIAMMCSCHCLLWII